MDAHQVLIDPPGLRFSARSEQTLLAAALAAGIELPSSCRNGTCRACMQLMRAGQVAYTIDWPGLLAEEKAEGWVLPCVAQARSDLVLQGQAA